MLCENKPWRNPHLKHKLHMGGKKKAFSVEHCCLAYLFLDNKIQGVCCKGATEFSGFDAEALSCEQVFHTSHSNRHTGCLAMVQCFNTKRFSFLFTKANLLCS